MGTRQSEQASLWVATAELPKSPKPMVGGRLRRLCMDKWVEYRILQIGWNCRAFIGYSKYYLRSLRFDGDKDVFS